MPRLKFVTTLSEAVKEQLTKIYREHPDSIYRRRAHAILLSGKGIPINQLQDIFGVDRDTVSKWIDLFETSGIEGLKPLPRPGRPPVYTDGEVLQLKGFLDQEPRQIKQAQAKLQQATGKSSCVMTLKRALKKNSATPGTAAGVRRKAGATPEPSSGNGKTSRPCRQWRTPG